MPYIRQNGKILKFCVAENRRFLTMHRNMHMVRFYLFSRHYSYILEVYLL